MGATISYCRGKNREKNRGLNLDANNGRNMMRVVNWGCHYKLLPM